MKVLYSGASNLNFQQLDSVDKSIRSLLEKAGVEYITLPNEKHCVEGLYNLGFVDVAKEEGEAFKKEVAEADVDMVITPYAVGVFMWERTYPNELGLSLDVPVVHVVNFFHDLFKKEKPEFSPVKARYFMHHGCTVGRKMGFYNEPRELLSMVPGLELVEEQHVQAQVQGDDPAIWNTCVGSWLNMMLPEMAEHVVGNYIQRVLMPAGPDMAGSTCANGHAGIAMGIMGAGLKVKPMFITEILDQAWR